MRFLYKSFGSPAALPQYVTSLENRLKSLCRLGDEVCVRGTTDAEVSGKPFRATYTLDTMRLIADLLGEKSQSFDAIIIGNMHDPGLSEVRQLLDIPVVGLGETTLLMATVVGTRVGILCNGERARSRVFETVQRIGIERRVVDVEALHSDIAEVEQSFGDEDVRAQVLEKMQSSCQMLVKSGADVLVVASGEIQTLLATHEVTQICDMPVIDGQLAALRMASLLSELRGLGRPYVSRVAAYTALPPQLFERARSAYRKIL